MLQQLNIKETYTNGQKEIVLLNHIFKVAEQIGLCIEFKQNQQPIFVKNGPIYSIFVTNESYFPTNDKFVRFYMDDHSIILPISFQSVILAVFHLWHLITNN